MNLLVPRINSYTRNSTHIINILNNITELPPHSVLYTLDVSSLYTNIPYEEGLTEMPHNIFLIDLLRSVLENIKLNHWQTFSPDCLDSNKHQVGTILCQLICVPLWGPICVHISIATFLIQNVHSWHISNLDILFGNVEDFINIWTGDTLPSNLLKRCHLMRSLSWTYLYTNQPQDSTQGCMSNLQIGTCISDITLNTQNLRDCIIIICWVFTWDFHIHIAAKDLCPSSCFEFHLPSFLCSFSRSFR